ncbi:MAG: helix-turn-helix transcriptional regulator [Alphaproteobacteria bacterium]|nr:helix-turn-helix transcriptional regulator [Alphaproteobacteria bacterium]MBO7066613.1 helix-turn-helix transcriptional regulator [Alphaproteobacteria bacterium]
MTIGEKIRALRKAQNLKQKDLAEKLNITAPALAFIENNTRQPSRELVIRLSEYFNQPTDYFLFPDTPNTKVSADTLFDILDIVNEFLTENHLYMAPEQRRLMVKHFYEQNLRDPVRIRETLSALRVVNGDMFTKGK